MNIEPTPQEQAEMAFFSLVNGMKNLLATLPATPDVIASVRELDAEIAKFNGEHNGTRH